jgi:hypothetical protein
MKILVTYHVVSKIPFIKICIIILFVMKKCCQLDYVMSSFVKRVPISEQLIYGNKIGALELIIVKPIRKSS